MQKILLGICVLIGGGIGAFYHNNYHKYEIDPNKVAINVPVLYEKFLKDEKLAIGEKYLAENLRDEFVRQNVEARLFSFEGTYLNRTFNNGFDIYMRSFPELRLRSYHDFIDKNKVSIIYETIPYELSEIKNADIVITGSLKRKKFYQKEGVQAYFIPQFTNTRHFYPAYKKEYQAHILFIANQWPDFPTRKSVAYALNNDIKIDVYGAGWENILVDDKRAWWRDYQVKNDELKYYYSSADIILNDTRQDMINAGYISNRIFDVSACKGFLISDYIPEIEAVFGDAIPMYKNEQEFIELIQYYNAHPEERRKKAEKAYQITMEKFTAEKAVKQMIKIMTDYRKTHLSAKEDN